MRGTVFGFDSSVVGTFFLFLVRLDTKKKKDFNSHQLFSIVAINLNDKNKKTTSDLQARRPGLRTKEEPLKSSFCSVSSLREITITNHFTFELVSSIS